MGRSNVNDIQYIVYWKQLENDEWEVSQKITLGEIIDNSVELKFDDGGTLPLNDINWLKDYVLFVKIPIPKEIKNG